MVVLLVYRYDWSYGVCQNGKIWRGLVNDIAQSKFSDTAFTFSFCTGNIIYITILAPHFLSSYCVIRTLQFFTGNPSHECIGKLCSGGRPDMLYIIIAHNIWQDFKQCIHKAFWKDRLVLEENSNFDSRPSPPQIIWSKVYFNSIMCSIGVESWLPKLHFYIYVLPSNRACQLGIIGNCN